MIIKTFGWRDETIEVHHFVDEVLILTNLGQRYAIRMGDRQLRIMTDDTVQIVGQQAEGLYMTFDGMESEK